MRKDIQTYMVGEVPTQVQSNHKAWARSIADNLEERQAIELVWRLDEENKNEGTSYMMFLNED